MELDLRTPEERSLAAAARRGERHQVNWLIQDGTITPKLKCLHGRVPERSQCAAQTLAEYPELLTAGYYGDSEEVRDGIIVSHWVGNSHHYPYDEAEFMWHYEDDDLRIPVRTQRHTLRFIIGEEELQPVFACLHPEGIRCDAESWREDIGLFPEWHAGPTTPLCAGPIVSWWSKGQPNVEELPYWAYEKHAAQAIAATLTPDEPKK